MTSEQIDSMFCVSHTGLRKAVAALRLAHKTHRATVAIDTEGLRGGSAMDVVLFGERNATAAAVVALEGRVARELINADFTDQRGIDVILALREGR